MESHRKYARYMFIFLDSLLCVKTYIIVHGDFCARIISCDVQCPRYLTVTVNLVMTKLIWRMVAFLAKLTSCECHRTSLMISQHWLEYTLHKSHFFSTRWSLSDKGTRVRFCWVPSHCGIDGNERVDQLAKETLDQDIDPLANVHYTDMKPLVNSYIQKLVQTKWDVAVHGRDLYLVKPTMGPPKKFQHLTRAEEVVITRLRIGHTKATKSHILSRGPPTGCHHCGETLTIDHMLLECALLQECRDEYYKVDSLNALFETIPETCIVEFLREAGFFYLIWCNLLISTSPQTFTIWSDLSNYLENESNSETHLLV